MDQLLDHISKTKRASDALPLDKRQDAEINLLPSLKHVDDGVFGLGRDGSAPHIEMFPKSGNTELIHVPLRFAYGITPEGICWHVPSGVKAERLKSALKPGEPLRAALSRARMAVLADAAIHAACTAVTDELDSLAVRYLYHRFGGLFEGLRPITRRGLRSRSLISGDDTAAFCD